MVVQPRARKVQSFRVKPKTWALFKEAVQKKGFSTCFILETLMDAWTASATAIVSVTESSTLQITQKIDYVVERPRRVKGFRTPLENCYLHGCWTYRKPEAGELLSKLHHVLECSCSVCEPFQGKALSSR
ncbi:hypothetical protein ES705_23007 [subsurface metagenome]